MDGLTLFAATTIPDWVGTFGSFIGLAIVLGGVAAGFWASRSKGIIELLKTENSAYKESNQRLHEELQTAKQDAAAAKAETKVWRDNVTQRPSIEKMIGNSQKQHQEYMIELGKVANGLSDLVKQQGELTKAIANAVLKGGDNGQ